MASTSLSSTTPASPIRNPRLRPLRPCWTRTASGVSRDTSSSKSASAKRVHHSDTEAPRKQIEKNSSPCLPGESFFGREQIHPQRTGRHREQQIQRNSSVSLW